MCKFINYQTGIVISRENHFFLSPLICSLVELVIGDVELKQLFVNGFGNLIWSFALSSASFWWILPKSQQRTRVLACVQILWSHSKVLVACVCAFWTKLCQIYCACGAHFVWKSIGRFLETSCWLLEYSINYKIIPKSLITLLKTDLNHCVDCVLHIEWISQFWNG